MGLVEGIGGTLPAPSTKIEVIDPVELLSISWRIREKEGKPYRVTYDWAWLTIPSLRIGVANAGSGVSKPL